MVAPDGVRPLAWATALAVAGYAVAAMLAWHTHSLGMIQLRPDHAPVQFNAAAGLLVAALGLAALMLNRRGWVAACAALCGALGGLTLVQYLFDVSLGIDNLLFHAYLHVHTSTPGRMAPGAALGLLLTGITLLGLLSARPAAAAAAGVCAVVAGSLAVLALTGYAAGVGMAYGWFRATRLDVPTALCMAALAAVLAAVCALRWRAQPALAPAWLPLLVSALMATSSCAIWLGLLDAETLQLQRSGKEALARLADRVTMPVQVRLEALGQMGGRWAYRGGAPGPEWEADAAALQRGSELLRAIEWVDRERIVRAVVPAQGNLRALKADMGAELYGLAAFETARAARRTTVTHVFQQPQGMAGMLSIHPVLVRGILEGYIVGVFDVNALLARTVARDAALQGYAVQVFDGERKLYGRHDDAPADDDLLQERVLALHSDVSLQVRLWPTRALLERQRAWLPWVVLAAGLFMTALFALITVLVQMANASATRLRAEVAERIKVSDENMLLMSELEVVFANVIVGIALIKDRHTVRCNMQYADMLGCQLDAVVGKPVAPSHPSETVEREAGPAVELALQTGQSFTVDLELERLDGSSFWAACFGKALDPSDIRKGTVWVVEDISVRKSAEARLLYQAQHDALTGLANRAMLGDRLHMAINRAVRHQHQMAVCYIDLDKFKYVNDTFGHETGDSLLLSVAERLLRCVRDTDTVARLGGDEFAVILSEGVDRQVVTNVMQRILATLSETMVLNDHQINVSGSIGVAVYPQHGLDAATLLKHADEAMYHAKQAGRNAWRPYAPLDPGT